MSPTVIKESTKNFDSDDQFSDDDFVLEGNGENGSESSDNASDVSYDSGDEKVIDSLKRKKTDNDDFFFKNYSDGVKTRSQKNRNEKVSIHEPESSQIDVNAIWNSMNEKKIIEKADYSSFNSSEEKVKISRIYEFAGKVEIEEKFVQKDSSEAKAHFSSLNTETDKPVLRKPTKRLSSLELANNKPVKLNTLEKSRLDWAKFVDKEGISEELKNASKDGYMDKQLFIQTAKEKMIKNIKEGMKK